MRYLDAKQATEMAEWLSEHGFEYTIGFGCRHLYDLLPEECRRLGPRWEDALDASGEWSLEAGPLHDGPGYWTRSPFPGVRVEEIQEKAEAIYEQQGGSYFYRRGEYEAEMDRRRRAVVAALEYYRGQRWA